MLTKSKEKFWTKLKSTWEYFIPWEKNVPGKQTWMNLTQEMEQCHIVNAEDPKQALCRFKSQTFSACFYASYSHNRTEGSLSNPRID